MTLVKVYEVTLFIKHDLYYSYHYIFIIGAYMSVIKTFRCIKCNEYIATSATQCRFCGVSIDPQTAEMWAELEEAEILEKEKGKEEEKIEIVKTKVASLKTLLASKTAQTPTPKQEEYVSHEEKDKPEQKSKLKRGIFGSLYLFMNLGWLAVKLWLIFQILIAIFFLWLLISALGGDKR